MDYNELTTDEWSEYLRSGLDLDAAIQALKDIDPHTNHLNKETLFHLYLARLSHVAAQLSMSPEDLASLTAHFYAIRIDHFNL